MMFIKLRFHSNMQNTVLLLLFVLFVDGVSGAETGISVMEGDSVTLHTDLTQILNGDNIVWSFGPERSFISHITREKDHTSVSVTDDEGFRGRLQLDPITGSLTIRNTRIRHAGHYQLLIYRRGTKPASEIFNLTVHRVISGTGGVKSQLVSVMEGESVTLNPDESLIHRDDLMLWMFGDKDILLAKLDAETKEISLYDAEERFRDRLKLDPQTGSLTIRNSRTTDSGLYYLQIRGRESSQQFILTVNQPDLSPGAVAAIVAVLAVAAVVAGVTYYRHTISEIRKQMYITRTNEKMMFEGDNLLRSTRTEHSGPSMLYDIESRSAEQRFFVTVNENVKVNLVKYGDSVTLKPDPEIQRDDQMLWMFGDQDRLIAQVKAGTVETYDDVADERFRGRLELDETTGSLTIRNIFLQHTGLYKLQTISRSKGTLIKKFRVSMQNSTVKRENESETVEMSLLGEKVPDAVNEQERRRSL